MEITPELVVAKVRAAGGVLVVKNLDDETLAHWRHAAKVAQLRLLRAGPERLRRSFGAGELYLRLERLDNDPDDDDDADDGALSWTPPPQVLPRTEEFVGRLVPVPSTVKDDPLVEQLVEAIRHSPYSSRIRCSGQSRAPREQRPLQKMRRIWEGDHQRGGVPGLPRVLSPTTAGMPTTVGAW